MSNTLFFLGDLASKPLNMDWAQEDTKRAEYWAGKVYNVYNYLMLKSVDYNDKSDCGVWGPCDESDYDDEDDEDDENNL